MMYNDTAYYLKSLYTFQIVKEAFEQGLFSKEDYDEFLRELISLESVEGGADMQDDTDDDSDDDDDWYDDWESDRDRGREE